MRVFVTSDSAAGTGVGEASGSICEKMEKEFKPKTFGPGLSEVVIVLMCRDPEYGFKQRVRHSRAERILYLDVMLDWDEMLRAGPKRRMAGTRDAFALRSAVLDAMKRTVREVFARRRVSDFDVPGFLGEFDAVCDRLGNRPQGPSFPVKLRKA
ncbi:MAG TPA: hypothetical protein VFI53_16580 [Myxococcaceae bacterium]|nr:hypothetical protein [Myxococcaceae bacterium]